MNCVVPTAVPIPTISEVEDGISKALIKLKEKVT